MKPELWDEPSAKCDHCGQQISECGPGLVTIDRESGTFTSDFCTCPDCVLDIHFGFPRTMRPSTWTLQMQRDGVQFSYIHWYWWTGGTHWYRFVDSDDVAWLYEYLTSTSQSTVVTDELERIANTHNPW